MDISIICALNKNNVIGKDNQLPWHISDELKYFKKNTLNKVLIMGRKTFESLGRRPLPKRFFIILSTQSVESEHEKVFYANTVDAALAKAQEIIASHALVDEVMIAGGANIYAQFLPLATKMYLSYIKNTDAGDTLFPSFDENKWKKDLCLEHDEFDAYVLEPC